MKWKHKGAPQFFKDREGRWRLRIPGDFEFESDEERETKENALKAKLREEIERALRGDSD